MLVIFLIYHFRHFVIITIFSQCFQLNMFVFCIDRTFPITTNSEIFFYIQQVASLQSQPQLPTHTLGMRTTTTIASTKTRKKNETRQLNMPTTTGVSREFQFLQSCWKLDRE